MFFIVNEFNKNLVYAGCFGGAVNWVSISCSHPTTRGVIIFPTKESAELERKLIADYGASLDDANYHTNTKVIELTVACDDGTVESVVDLLRQRSRLGVKKYGITLSDSNLQPDAFIRHALEEALDLANYLMQLKSKFVKKDVSK